MIALAWQDKALSLLDQSRYPEEEVWINCPDWKKTAEVLASGMIVDEKIAGIAAAYGYCLAALEAQDLQLTPAFDQKLEAAKQGLLSSRPNSREVAAAIDSMEHPPEAYTQNTDRLTTILATAVTFDRKFVVSSRNICRNGAKLMGEGTRVLLRTDCGAFHSAANNGALGIARRAWKQGILQQITLCEGRPSLTAAHVLASELTIQNEIPCTVIPDHAAATFLSQQGAHMILTDGIRMAKNGDLLAPVGAYELAIACYFHSIPFYGVLYTADVSLDTPSGAAFGQPDGDPDTVATLQGLELVSGTADSWTPAYDIVPAMLVTGIITDRSVVYPPYEDTLEELVKFTPDRNIINFDA